MKRALYFFVLVNTLRTIFASCRVSDISVQPNFDISKYVGLTWYEQSWLPAPNHSPESLSQDYTNTYYLHPDGTTITAFVNGRDPPDLTKCFYYTEQFRITGAPGKWLRKRGDRTTDYWIVSTDYTSYSVAYGCQEQDTLGNCAVPLVWVWSRAPDILPKGTINIVDNILDALCVNKSAFLETDQTNGILSDFDTAELNPYEIIE